MHARRGLKAFGVGIEGENRNQQGMLTLNRSVAEDAICSPKGSDYRTSV